MNQDHEHLKLLSIFYYIGAALTALGMLAPVVFLLTVTSGFEGGGLGRSEMFFLGAMTGGALLCGAAAACLALTGKYLAEKSHYNFCFVMACIAACLVVPLGTALGVLTILVLLRPSVKGLFGVPVTVTAVPAHS